MKDITRTSEGWRRRMRQWRKVRDCLEGEERVRDRGILYLPRPRGMKPIDYTNYVSRASFYGVAERTLRGMCGLVFRVNPVIEVPPDMTPILEMATPEGFTMNQLLREAVQEVLSMGRYGVLVDLDPNPNLTPIPYLATYKAEDIFRWEERTVGARRKLVRVVVREEVETADHETSRFIRELAIDPDGVYRQRIYEEEETERSSSTLFSSGPATFLRTDEELDFLSGSFVQVDERTPTIQGRPLSDIPFWFMNVFDMRPRTVKPPFLDMVNLNLAHYRNSADYEQSLFMTSQPTPYIFGVPKSDVPKGIGAGALWHSENRDVNVGFLEFSGPGISAIERAMEAKEGRMAAVGARLIMDVEKADNVTAETTRLQTRAETSVLIGGIDTVNEAFRKALEFAAAWAGDDPDEVRVSLNQDFIETRMTPDEQREMVASWQAGAISRKTLHENLQRGEIVAPDRTLEEELELIEMEGDTLGGPPPPPTPPPPPGGGGDDEDDDEGDDE